MRVAFLLLFFLFSCTIPELTRGKPNDIVIFSSELPRSYSLLASIFQDTIYTPQPEPFFNIIGPVKTLEKYRGYSTIIILTTSHKEGLFSNIKGEGLYIKRGVFQKKDLIIVLKGPKEEAIMSTIYRNGDKIFSLVREHIISLFHKQVYSIIDINKELKESVFRKYGFTFDFPLGYNIIGEDNNFIAFLKHYPDRFLFVWTKNKSLPLEINSIISIRDSLTREHYNGDYIDRNLLRHLEVTFNEEDALILYGHWENEQLKVGGAFKSFAFNRKGKFYLVDIGVYQPGKPKLKYLWWMESIVRTMLFKDESSTP